MKRIRENVFRIWGNIFLVFRTTMALKPDKAVDVTLATVALHNMLRVENKEGDTCNRLLDIKENKGTVIDGDWRTETVDFSRSLPTNGAMEHVLQQNVCVTFLHLFLWTRTKSVLFVKTIVIMSLKTHASKKNVSLK